MLTRAQTTLCVQYALEVLLGAEAQVSLPPGSIGYIPPREVSLTSARLVFLSSGFFDVKYGMPDSVPTLPLKSIQGVPLLFGKPHITRHKDSLVIHADILASTFFLVTRYEETVRRTTRDEHGRFLGRESLQNRAGFLDRPVVEEYAALLRKWLAAVGITVPSRPTSLSVALTHDIDQVQKFPGFLRSLRMMPKRGFLKEGLGHFADNVMVQLGLRSDPFDNVPYVLRMDHLLGNRSPNRQKPVVFFSSRCGGKHEVTYRVQRRVAKKAVQTVQSMGGTIGLHTSYLAGIHPELIAEEKARLEEVCHATVTCNRHHFLSWREVEHGWYLKDAGIEEDYSLGFADAAGFRLGVCHPVPLFDPIRLRPFGITEHPLIVMDCTLDEERFMGLDETEAFTYCCELIRQTRKHGGEFVILWHNSGLAEGSRSYHTTLYPRLLRHIACIE